MSQFDEFNTPTFEQLIAIFRDRDESHGIDHARKTRDIARGFKYSSDVVATAAEIAAFVHDANDAKYLHGGAPLILDRLLIKFIASKHPKLDASALVRLARACNCAIEHNSYSKETKWLAAGTSARELIRKASAVGGTNFDADAAIEIWEAVSAADKSQAMGAIGLVRTFEYTQDRNRQFTREDVFYGVLHHAWEKLVILIDMVPQRHREFVMSWHTELCNGIVRLLECIEGFMPKDADLRKQIKQAVDERGAVDLDALDRVYLALRKASK